MKPEVESMIWLQKTMKDRQAEWADGKITLAGDFSYAWKPRVKTWGEGTVCRIGKFCSIAAGVPAVVKRYRFPPGVRTILQKMRWWDWPLEKIAEAVPLLQSGKWVEFFDKYNEEEDNGQSVF